MTNEIMSSEKVLQGKAIQLYVVNSINILIELCRRGYSACEAVCTALKWILLAFLLTILLSKLKEKSALKPVNIFSTVSDHFHILHCF